MKTFQIAIIGAGAAGLCAARHVASRTNMKPVVFERSRNVGGVWCYTDKTDRDEYGLKIHSAMYKNLRTNLPKEVMEFPDFPFSADDPSFLSHEGVQKYLSSYCSHFDLEKYIKFESLVRHVKPVSSSGPWEVTVENLGERSLSTTVFDAVIVCNGHYATPHIPSFPGDQHFKGTIMHSHSYRSPEPYCGKRVIVLGCKSSGQDISLDVAKRAKSVIISQRTAYLTCPLPENVTQVSSVESFKEDGTTVCFQDGSQAEVDDIIYCTGYKYDLTLLDQSCDVAVDGGRVCYLYKHVINPSYPSLMFIGICTTICPFPHFNLQVLYCLAALDGSLKLPSKEEMKADIENDYQSRLRRGIPHRKSHMLGALQWQYNDELADAIQVPRLHPRIQQLYDDVYKIRARDMTGYRENKISTLDSGFYRIFKD